MNEKGRPLRSRTLSRRLSEEAGRAERAMQNVGRVRERIRQTELALIASSQRPPRGRGTSAEDGEMIVPVMKGPGADRIGPFLTSKRLAGRPSYLSVPNGTGAISALREGEVWADVSSGRQSTFTAQVDPSRLVKYNEMLVPHISGKVWLRLFHDSGRHEYGPFEMSSLLRFEEPRRFNGRIEIESISDTTTDGDYIHTLGGLELRETDWAGEWDLEAEIEAPAGGTIDLKTVSVYPGGQEISFSVEDPSGNSLSKQTPVSEGDRLRILSTDVDPTLTASFLQVTYDYI